jgi:exonuclease SbcC
MKILNLKFKNINSLSGENEIDFTNPVFTNEGLFAITGKTGAGKSSILDAISLAFYGKTPRVDITGSENAVMTKGEKDCFAEITFEVAGKKWKSSWKQERARTGTLKPVNRQIADFNNKIIADQVRSCDAEIIKILGLTFEQFTKVIMLAQGSFAAFLQADKNDKGQLLEQITGTEIYAEISKIVFERNRTEKDKLDKISLELEAIKILTEEEIEILTNENTVIEKEKLQVDEELQKIEKAKKWLSDVSNLQTQINQAKEKLPELEEKTKTAKETFEKSELALKTAKSEQRNQEPIFKRVRELDTKISEKEKLLNPILTAISDLTKSKTELSKTIDSQNSELKKSEASLNEKQRWITDNKKYEDLVSNYSAIEKENQLLVDSSKEIEKQNSEIADLHNKLKSKISVTTKAAEVFNEKSEKLNAKTKELETKRTELAELLGGKELSKLQTEKENIANFGLQIKSLIDVENSIEESQKEIENLDEKLKQFEKSNTELAKSITADKKTIENFEQQINLLDENIKLTKTIQSLDEHRHNLKDGEECPLCGALEHPFAKGNIPKIGEKEKELASLKKQLQETNSTLQQNEKKLERLVSDNKNDSENKTKAKNILTKNTEKQKEILAELKSINSTFSIPKGENKIERLNEKLVQKQDKLKELNKLIEQATNSETVISNLRDKEIPVLQKEKEEATAYKNEAEKTQKLAEQGLKDKQESANKSQEKYKVENEEFLKKLKKYSVENIETLKKYLDFWNENKKQTEELTNQITTLKGNIAVNNKEFENQTKSLESKQKEKQNIDIEKQELEVERKVIFEDKSVDVEENRLKKLVEDSESSKTKAEQEKTDTDKKLAENKAIVTEKEKDLLNTQEQQITEKTNEELQSEFVGKKIKVDEFSQKIGANNQTLKSNADNLKTSGSKLKEKEKQQAICNKWGILNTLIGSNDGKKYRNFAQALTFEHLIGLSNRQLQKMSDRYILKSTSDTTNPFELYVIDKFQNSDERTAQNLSGGEKFIISLSLALGLANMASKNMRIDTMFIDEGFGTLDSDYLDVALNALSNLQSEGKVIGVISHLTELKERIATHVEVVPSGNGHSKIQITK